MTTPVQIQRGSEDEISSANGAVFVALERLGKEVELLEHEGESHALQKPANIIDFWQRRLDFLAQHLDLTYDAQGAIAFDGDRARSREGEQRPDW